MSDLEIDEQLDRLTRDRPSSRTAETDRVQATGQRPAATLIEIVSLVERNIYNVKQLALTGEPLYFPVNVGGNLTQAVNIAEHEIATGQLTPGQRAIMWPVSGGYAFNVQP